MSLIERRGQRDGNGTNLLQACRIQGVAFSYLLGAVHDRLDHLTVSIALRAFASLELIVAVWSLYGLWAFALVWYPSALDAIIPFSLGAAEVLLCLSMGENMVRWLGFAVIVLLMAFLSLAYIYRRAPFHTRNSGVFGPVMQRFRANVGPLVGIVAPAVPSAGSLRVRLFFCKSEVAERYSMTRPAKPS
ncbi:MAG: hypothetical protein M3Z66_23005 [Chloroflexota bacterium]|nr:hypothetical protein [Chloroflexota bacterium]